MPASCAQLRMVVTSFSGSIDSGKPRSTWESNPTVPYLVFTPEKMELPVAALSPTCLSMAYVCSENKGL